MLRRQTSWTITSQTVLMSECQCFQLVICAMFVPVSALNISLQMNLKYMNYLLVLMWLSPLVLTKLQDIWSKTLLINITPAVTAIFNQSICEGKFPTEWKKSRTTPVPKSYDHSVVENFRPISILSKELEHIFHNQLLEEINSDKQWGFSQGKSTVGTLLTTVDN